MKNKKYALFDMDGVLFDSMPNHAIAYHEALLPFGINMTAEQVYAMEGMKGTEAISRVYEEQMGAKLPISQAEALYEEKCKVYRSLPAAGQIEGAYHLMHTMYDHGWEICIVTGSGQASMLEKLSKEYAPMITPDRIISSKDYAKGKPSPDPYLMGLQRLGAKAEETVVIENAPLGVRAGRAAGIFTIAVNTGPLSDDYFVKADASQIFATMADAERYLFG